MTEHEDPGVLGRCVHPMDPKQFGDTADHAVDEAERHSWRASLSPNPLVKPAIGYLDPSGSTEGRGRTLGKGTRGSCLDARRAWRQPSKCSSQGMDDIFGTDTMLRSGRRPFAPWSLASRSKRPVKIFAAAQTPTPPSPPAALTGVRVLPPKGLNNSLYLDLNHFSRHTAWAHGFMHDYALWLGPVLLAAVFVATYGVAWWRRALRATALLILGGIGTIIALGLNQLVGHAAKELRPYVDHPKALVLVARANDYSFPSDHSVVAGGLTISILLMLGSGAWRSRRHARRGLLDADTGGTSVPVLVRILAAASVLLGLFLCFARVYVGAHYPGDVVAGYLLAAVAVLAVSLLRPFAYLAVDLVDMTAVGNLLRRSRAASAGEPASE